MIVLYTVCALLALAIPAAIVLGERGRTVDERRNWHKKRMWGRRAADHT